MSESNREKLLDYVFTQQYIWESMKQSDATFVDSDIQKQYVEFKKEIDEKISKMEKVPSFDSTTQKVLFGQTTILKDKNKVLKDYKSIDKTVDGIRFKHTQGENTLEITVNQNCTLNKFAFDDSDALDWGLYKDGTEDNDTSVYITFKKGVQDQLYALNYNDPVTMALKITIEKLGSLELSKLNEEGNLIDGAIYQVDGPSGYSKEVTITNGRIKLENLKVGTYTVKEKKAPYSYVLDPKSYSVEVKANETAKQAIVNKEVTGTWELTKLNNDETAFIEGAAFRLWNNNGYDKTFYTDSNGRIKVEGLKLGKYFYQESLATEGYLIDSKEYSFTLEYEGQLKSIVYKYDSLKNSEPTATISLIKEDSQTGNIPQGDATFNGAKYGLFANEDIYNKARTTKKYSKGDLVATRIIDNQGKTEDITNLPLGKYILKELESSEGYLLDTKEYVIDLKYKDQYTKIITESIISKEDIKSQQIHIFKAGIKELSGEVKGLKDAEFTIKLYSDVERALAKGYTYAEIWNGLDENGNTVSVNPTRVAEAQKIAKTYDIVKTDENGNAYTKLLPYGTFWGKETYTPNDFITATDFSFTVNKDTSEIEEIAQKVKNIFINNEQMESYIKLIKKDKNTGKLVSLNGTSFVIKAAENIYDRGTKKLIYSKGQTITQKVGTKVYSSFTTNADNVIIPDNSYFSEDNDKATVVTPLTLPVGHYEVYENSIAKGFLDLTEPVKFEIENIRTYEKDETGDYIKEVIIENEQPTAKIVINKKINLRQDVDTSLLNDIDFTQIQFELKAKTDIIDMADGSVIYSAGTSIGKYNLQKDASLKIEDLPLGVYEVFECTTAKGLVLDTTVHEVKFEQKDTTTKIYIATLDISNDTTITQFSKQDITGDKELPNAHLSILDENGNIIYSWVSTEKQHIIEGLEVDKQYILHEDLSPLGFAKATDIFFKITNTNEIQEVKMIDKIIEMSKVDISGNEIIGANMKVLDENNEIVDEWISEKEPHKIKNLEEGKTYTLIEELPTDGYVKASNIEFTVTTDKETQKIVMVDKIVEMSKVDVSGNEIIGANMKVLNENNEIIDEWISEKEPHKIKNLEEGKTYTLIEELPADGYVKASNIKFTVTTDKKTQKVIMIDKILKVLKIDSLTGDAVTDCELEVVDADGKVIDSWISTKEAHIVKGLEENKTYTLIEKKSALGYNIAENITFTVTTDKETQIIELKNQPILCSVKVEKIDKATGEHIKSNKFVFGLFEDPECTKLIKEAGANEFEGSALFDNLRYGVFYIKEQRAPLGYELSSQVVKIEINQNGVFADGVSLENVDSTYSFVYYNSLLPIVQTGNETNYALLVGLSIVSLSCITVSIILLRKKKNR